jgi:hypothetical protein
MLCELGRTCPDGLEADYGSAQVRLAGMMEQSGKPRNRILGQEIVTGPQMNNP